MVPGSHRPTTRRPQTLLGIFSVPGRVVQTPFGNGSGFDFLRDRTEQKYSPKYSHVPRLYLSLPVTLGSRRPVSVQQTVVRREGRPLRGSRDTDLPSLSTLRVHTQTPEGPRTNTVRIRESDGSPEYHPGTRGPRP